MIDVGNRPKATRSYDKGVNGLHHRGSAFGIVGGFRFDAQPFCFKLIQTQGCP